MCLIAFAWRAHPRYPLVVAANRDEWRARPTAPAHAWDDGILAGRDLQAGGTWLGITRTGRFAALTNVREPSVQRPGAPSRGALVADFLRSKTSPRAHLEQLDPTGYAGFNLLVSDGATLAYFGSQRGEILDVEPGVHALSNHRLDEPWPKVRRSKDALRRAVEDAATDAPRIDSLLDLLSHSAIAPDADLPDTGVGLSLERRLSPILLVGGEYGTRCSTVVRFDANGPTDFDEWTRDETGRVSSQVTIL